MIHYSQSLTRANKIPYHRVWSTSSLSELVLFLEQFGYASIEIHKMSKYSPLKNVHYVELERVSLHRLKSRMEKKQLEQVRSGVEDVISFTLTYKYWNLR